MTGADVGEKRVTASNESILSVVLEINQRLERLERSLAPLLPHIPKALRLLDNPASRWKERRAVRQGGTQIPEPVGAEVHREAG